MTKLEFLMSLHDKLSCLPPEDADERLRFYGEMIDDRMEEGLLEEDAVAAVGSVENIATQIISDNSPSLAATAKRRRKWELWEILLMVLGSPLWLSLLIAGFAVVFSVYVSLWAVIVSFWAVFASLIACAFAGIIMGIVFICAIHRYGGVAMIGAGIVCAGLSILLFFGCDAVTKGTLSLTKRFVKKCFAKKEDSQCV